MSPKGNVLVEPESVINSFNDSTVTLTCTTAGGPYNVYTWTHRTTGIEVAASSQYSVEISIFTAGEYECSVGNLAGNDSNTTTINGKGMDYVIINKVSGNSLLYSTNSLQINKFTP